MFADFGGAGSAPSRYAPDDGDSVSVIRTKMHCNYEHLQSSVDSLPASTHSLNFVHKLSTALLIGYRGKVTDINNSTL